MDQKKQEILDSDIATIEALHDALLDKGMDSTALMMIRSRTLTTKLHAIIEDEQESVWTEPSPGISWMFRQWKDIATAEPYLRFPNIDVNFKVFTDTSIRFKTFVKDPESGRLLYVQDSYMIERGEDVISAAAVYRKHFEQRCELHLEKAVFNEATSIKEPNLS